MIRGGFSCFRLKRRDAGARGTLGLLEAGRAAQGFDPDGEQVNHQPAEQPGRRPCVGKGAVAASSGNPRFRARSPRR